jgi:hypothetical protein
VEAVTMKKTIEICKWCYKYKSLDDHKVCKSKSKKALRSRRQNLDLVNSRVDRFSSPRHNQNKYLTEAQNMEILIAYYERGWLKTDPRNPS